jgi:hypothetical protein
MADRYLHPVGLMQRTCSQQVPEDLVHLPLAWVAQYPSHDGVAMIMQQQWRASCFGVSRQLHAVQDILLASRASERGLTVQQLHSRVDALLCAAGWPNAE